MRSDDWNPAWYLISVYGLILTASRFRADTPRPSFFGIGLGSTRTWLSETGMTLPRTPTVAPCASRTDIAWMLTEDVAAVVDERATPGLAWRYSDLGKVRMGRGENRVIWRDVSRELPLPDLAETLEKLAVHGFRPTLLYACRAGRCSVLPRGPLVGTLTHLQQFGR